MLGALLSMKGASFLSLIGLIVADPSNTLKISLCHFCYNLIMALVVLLFSSTTAKHIANSLPFKGSIVGILMFTLFKRIPETVMHLYDHLVYGIGPFYLALQGCQLINVIFSITRAVVQKSQLQKPDEEEQEEQFTLFQKFLVFIIIAFTLIVLFFSTYTLYIYLEDVMKFNLYFSFILLILILIFMNILTLQCETPNAVITNSSSFTLYLTFMYGTYIKSYKKYEALRHSALKSPSWLHTIENATGLSLTTLGSKVWQLQQRISNFVFSFIADRGYNIEGFFSYMKNDNIFSVTLAVLLLLSIPLTLREWPVIGKDLNNMMNEEEPNQGGGALQFDKYKRRVMSQNYLLSAFLVLMVTKFTLQSLNYQEYREERSLFLTSLPFISICISSGYYFLKLLRRDDQAN